MASSMIHLAITQGLLNMQAFHDPARLRLGVILPDGAIGGNSHLKQSICNGTRFHYDLEFYREHYITRMQADDLYLGYYLHLVQDTFFRQFIYGEHHFDSSIPANVEKLHHDYAITNYAVARKYHLTPEMLKVIDITDESILEIASFDVSGLVEEVRQQFAPVEGECTVFTPQMAVELVERSITFCLEELEHLAQGQPGLDSFQWNWDNRGR